jgi:hypothetical protein
MMKKFLFLLILLTACTDNSTAYRVLKNDGYTNIMFTGYSWFACSRDDFYHTGFIAVKNQNKVSGTVCSGLIFKNATIRFE